jgi:hypothetical protein
MTLTSFIKLPEVSIKIKIIHPKISRIIPAYIKVKPRSNHYMLVGTAFDYMLRFEIKRLAHHVNGEEWIAEHALERINKKNDSGTYQNDYLFFSEPDDYLPPDIVARRVKKILKDSKSKIAWYCGLKVPTHSEQEKIARCAILLAKLDMVYRSSRLDPKFEEADQADIQDLIDMISIVPIQSLINHNAILLNPNFGESSLLVGGADTDLIIDDLLIDIKTTIKSGISTDNLNQLLGYYILTRNQHHINPNYPVINKLGIYFSRHGYLWTIDANLWTNNSEFQEIEKWFVEKANEIYSK